MKRAIARHGKILVFSKWNTKYFKRYKNDRNVWKGKNYLPHKILAAFSTKDEEPITSANV